MTDISNKSATLGQLRGVMEHEDAKIDELKGDIADVKKKVGAYLNVEPSWTNAKRIIENGSIVNSGNSFYMSDFINVISCEKVICYSLNAYTSVTMPSIHYYDESKNHVGFTYAYETYDCTQDIEVYNAKYIRLSQYSNNDAHSTQNVHVEFITDSEFAEKVELERIESRVESLDTLYGIIYDVFDITFEMYKCWTISTSTHEPVYIQAAQTTYFCGVPNRIFLTKGSIISFDSPLKLSVFGFDVNGKYNSDYDYIAKTEHFIANQDMYVVITVEAYKSTGEFAPTDSVKVLRKYVSASAQEYNIERFKESTGILSKYDGFSHSSVFDEEIADTIHKVESVTKSRALSFIVVTDTHVDNYNVNSTWADTVSNMLTISEECPVDGVIHMGDMVNGSYNQENSLKLIRSIRNACINVSRSKNAYILTGNHDTNTFYNNMADPITEETMYSVWGKHVDKIIVRTPKKLYFYEDYEDLNVRVIYLHSSMGDGTHGGTGSNWGYPMEECDWVRDVSLNTNKQILLVSHMPLSKNLISSATSNLPQNGDIIIGHISNFIENGGIVIGLIHGHTHADWIYDNGYFKECSFDCNVYEEIPEDISPSETYAPANSIHNARLFGTVTQDLFDYVIIMPDDRRVSIVRFGAGNDRSWTY